MKDLMETICKNVKPFTPDFSLRRSWQRPAPSKQLMQRAGREQHTLPTPSGVLAKRWIVDYSTDPCRAIAEMYDRSEKNLGQLVMAAACTYVVFEHWSARPRSTGLCELNTEHR